MTECKTKETWGQIVVSEKKQSAAETHGGGTHRDSTPPGTVGCESV